MLPAVEDGRVAWPKARSGAGRRSRRARPAPAASDRDLAKRRETLERVLAGELVVPAAAEELGLSERHTRRLLAAYRRAGEAALAHGNRGRTPANAISDATRAQVLARARGEQFRGWSYARIAERLVADLRLGVSARTLRRLIAEAAPRAGNATGTAPDRPGAEDDAGVGRPAGDAGRRIR
jgi:transposase